MIVIATLVIAAALATEAATAAAAAAVDRTRGSPGRQSPALSSDNNRSRVRLFSPGRPIDFRPVQFTFRFPLSFSPFIQQGGVGVAAEGRGGEGGGEGRLDTTDIPTG